MEVKRIRRRSQAVNAAGSCAYNSGMIGPQLNVAVCSGFAAGIKLRGAIALEGKAGSGMDGVRCCRNSMRMSGM